MLRILARADRGKWLKLAGNSEISSRSGPTPAESRETASAGSYDAFVSKYDAAGTLVWTRQLGTGSGDGCYGVSADGLGSVYISGYTAGNLGGASAGSFDAFVSKYDAAGTLAWTRQLGTGSDDVSFGVSADGLGNVYFSGYTYGNLGGASAGGADAFVSKIVPEPTGAALALGAAVAVLALRRKRG
jgi:hypothetical protein